MFEQFAKAYITGQDLEEAAEEVPEEPAKEEPAQNNSFDAFEDLARAYFEKKQLRKPAKKEAATPESPIEPIAPEEPKEPEPYKIGYAESDNSSFTEQELEDLTNGGQIEKGEDWYHHAYFTAVYSKEVRVVYRSHMYKTPTLSLNNDAKISGFIINGNYYTNMEPIAAKLSLDIDHRIKEIIPDEETAEKYAVNLSDWVQKSIEDEKKYSRLREAQNLFYEGKIPNLTIYSDTNISKDDLVKYILNPSEFVERFADSYIESNIAAIYKDYIRFNGIIKEYNSIISDQSREERELLKIRNCITDEKTVRIELSNGHEVKVDADSVKQITSRGYISDYDVSACDRQYLRKGENNRTEDIILSDIVAIRHGGKVLYKAA